MARHLDITEIMRRTNCEEVIAEGGGWEAAGQCCVLQYWLSENTEEHAVYIGNAFSLQMLAEEQSLVSVVPADWDEIPANVISCIGHADTAAVASSLAGREIPCNRISVTLRPGDEMFVIQVTGGRLPEGSTTLPEGVKMELKRVLVR